MARSRSSLALLALFGDVASAWNDCEFPEVDYFAIDEGVGISYTYALAAMNGNMYSGGYTKGNFAFVGVKKEGEDDVTPLPSAALWGQTTSNTQNLYIAEVSVDGQMTKGWHFKGTAIQEGEIGHGPQTNSIDAHSGMHKMMDKKHIAVQGSYKGKLLLPDGITEWDYGARSSENMKDSAPFVMKLDVSTINGIGAGTTGWAKQMDLTHPGGATVYSVDGTTQGDMIVTYKGCGKYDATAVGTDAYGRPTTGAASDCKYYLTKLKSDTGATDWIYEVPRLSSCRVITDGSTFCTFSVVEGVNYPFSGLLPLLTGSASKVGIVKFNPTGEAIWAKETASGTPSDLSVNSDGSLLAVVGYTGGGAPAFIARIDTSSGKEGEVLWTDQGGVGTHGFRGVEVTADPNQVIQEVVAFGQVVGVATLADTSGATTTLRSRGSYEVFVVAYDASDGTGKYAMDGGGTGMEYFFAFARDPVTNDVYIGGTSRSEKIQWGNVERNNPMYNGDPGKNNPDTSSAVGSSKAFTVKLKSKVELPSCLTSCAGNIPEVKEGFCYIDRYCYANEKASPYDAAHACYQCDVLKTQVAWSGPVGLGESFCLIGGQCVADGAAKKLTSGRSTVDSECETCQAKTKHTDYSVVNGYSVGYTEGVSNGKCVEKTWQTEAAAAGWNLPLAACDAGDNIARERARRARSLSPAMRQAWQQGQQPK